MSKKGALYKHLQYILHVQQTFVIDITGFFLTIYRTTHKLKQRIKQINISDEVFQ